MVSNVLHTNTTLLLRCALCGCVILHLQVQRFLWSAWLYTHDPLPASLEGQQDHPPAGNGSPGEELQWLWGLCYCLQEFLRACKFKGYFAQSCNYNTLFPVECSVCCLEHCKTLLNHQFQYSVCSSCLKLQYCLILVACAARVISQQADAKKCHWDLAGKPPGQAQPQFWWKPADV